MSARGGPRTPDGVQRPAALPFGKGPNRSDLSQLPGTPGTVLPPNPAEPDIGHGQVGSLRGRLNSLPLQTQSFSPSPLSSPSARPGEPITAGVDVGAGPGSDGLIPSPVKTDNSQAVAESMYMFPLLMRLATMPGATTQTKILAQRMRGLMPTQPEKMPQFPEI